MRRTTKLAFLMPLAGAASVTMAQPQTVSSAINQFGLDVLRAHSRAASAGNALLSPYSVASALAMTWVGADGQTHDEMRRVLHLPGDDALVLAGYSDLARQLTELQTASRQRVAEEKKYGASSDPVTINIANRLFTQSGFALRPDFTATLRDQFSAPLEALDFRRDAESARRRINTWVAQETHDKIRDLVPEGAIGAATRAVLANALYLRAPWASRFEQARTKDAPFWANGATRADVPTMMQQEDFRYAQRDGFVALALPYADGGLQCVILLPDERDGLGRLEAGITPELLAECARLPRRDVILHLPKFTLDPPALPLGAVLRDLGMPSAFDQPPGSANFDRMAPRGTDNYLFLSEVFHQTWLSLDETGTEAAAATAAVMAVTSAPVGPPPKPIEVRVEHPFLFVIQHTASGACLFLGRVVDPR